MSLLRGPYEHRNSKITTNMGIEEQRKKENYKNKKNKNKKFKSFPSKVVKYENTILFILILLNF